MIKLSPINKYKQDLAKDDFLFDAAQENAVMHLQRLYEDLQTKPLEVSSFKRVLNRWKKVYKKHEEKPIKGLYFLHTKLAITYLWNSSNSIGIGVMEPLSIAGKVSTLRTTNGAM